MKYAGASGVILYYWCQTLARKAWMNMWLREYWKSVQDTKNVKDTQPLISEMSQFVLCKHANMLKCGDIVEMMINFWTVC